VNYLTYLESFKIQTYKEEREERRGAVRKKRKTRVTVKN
jgi:hypothetical protein